MQGKHNEAGLLGLQRNGEKGKGGKAMQKVSYDAIKAVKHAPLPASLQRAGHLLNCSLLSWPTATTQYSFFFSFLSFFSFGLSGKDRVSFPVPLDDWRGRSLVVTTQQMLSLQQVLDSSLAHSCLSCNCHMGPSSSRQDSDRR